MITKERLKELIEQGKTIYSSDTKLYGLAKWLELENRLEKLEFNENGEVKLFIIDNGWWHWFNLNDLYEDLEKLKDKQKISTLEKQLATMEKALELACEYLNDYQYFDSDCPRYSDCYDAENSKFWDCENCDCSKLAMDYFKKQAEKELKNEVNND